MFFLCNVFSLVALVIHFNERKHLFIHIFKDIKCSFSSFFVFCNWFFLHTNLYFFLGCCRRSQKSTQIDGRQVKSGRHIGLFTHLFTDTCWQTCLSAHTDHQGEQLNSSGWQISPHKPVLSSGKQVRHGIKRYLIPWPKTHLVVFGIFYGFASPVLASHLAHVLVALLLHKVSRHSCFFVPHHWPAQNYWMGKKRRKKEKWQSGHIFYIA